MKNSDKGSQAHIQVQTQTQTRVFTEPHLHTERGKERGNRMMAVNLFYYIISSRHFTNIKKSIQFIYFFLIRPPGAGIQNSQELIIHPKRTMSAVPRANRCLAEFTFSAQARVTGSDVTGQLRLGSGCHILAVYGVSLLCLRRGRRVLCP